MRPASAEFGIRPRFGDRPISHAEWQTSTGAAGPPTGGSAARHIAKPMTTPVTVSQATNTRSPNNPAAAGHRRRARRSPGRSPGTTDFASRPGFPTISAGDRYRTGESAMPAGRRPHRTASPPAIRFSSTRATIRRVAYRGMAPGTAARARTCGPGLRGRAGPRVHPRVRSTALPTGTRILTRTAVGRTPGPQRSRSCDRPRRRPASGRTGARTHTLPGTRSSARARHGARSCCKTEIPG